MGIFHSFKSMFARSTRSSGTVTTGKLSANNLSLGSNFQGELANNETIFAAVSILANTLASLPIKLKQAFKDVDNHPLAALLYSPNSYQTIFDFIRTMEVYRDTTGNAYALKEYNSRYQVTALHIIDPAYVEPVFEEDNRELWYRVTTTGGSYYFHNADLIHVKHIHGPGHKGINPLSVLKNTTDYDGSVRKFSLSQMKNSIKASFVINVATTLDKERRQRMLESFKEFYETDGSGVLLAENGVTINQLKNEFIDSKLFEVEGITRARVASVYNLPAYKLGNVDKTSNSRSVEQQSIEFVQTTLVPIIKQYESEFNKKLLTQAERRKGYDFKFNVNGLLRGDMKTRGEFYSTGVRSGFFKPNDVRQWEDLPPEEGGDILFISGDLYDIRDTNRGTVRGGERNEQVLPGESGGEQDG